MMTATIPIMIEIMVMMRITRPMQTFNFQYFVFSLDFSYFFAYAFWPG